MYAMTLANIRARLPRCLSFALPPHTKYTHLLTYLLALVLSSISLLVFVNSTISFVVTDILGIRHGDKAHGHKNVLGNIVGTLGFIDEIMVILSAPAWGILSDKWRGSKWGGRRGVAGLGFIIIALGIVGLSAAGITKGRNGVGKGIQLEGWEWFWYLIFWRAVFAIGGGAVTTMISAVLPDLTAPAPESGGCETLAAAEDNTTPATGQPSESSVSNSCSSSQLAGIVGLFSGLGALLALAVFLPLPTLLDPTRRGTKHYEPGDSPGTTGTGQGLKRAYWIVSAYAIVCSLACWIGLPHGGGSSTPHGDIQSRIYLGEEIKHFWNKIFHHRRSSNYIREDTEEERGLLENDPPSQAPPTNISTPSSRKMFLRAISLGSSRFPTIGISYLGGFIARASSVGLSLFIPLFVNHYFISQGLCNPDSNPADKETMKRECRRAYILAAELTGISQFVALLAAPVIGYLSSPASSPSDNASLTFQSTTLPTAALKVLFTTSILGTVGFIGFGLLPSPEISLASLVFSSLIGIGQIGAVVGSLGLLGRGVSAYSTSTTSAGAEEREQQEDGNSATSALDIKGSIAGVYSLCGGIGILLLTKGGGLLFDKIHSGAPFWALGVFMGILGGVTGWLAWRGD